MHAMQFPIKPERPAAPAPSGPVLPLSVGASQLLPAAAASVLALPGPPSMVHHSTAALPILPPMCARLPALMVGNVQAEVNQQMQSLLNQHAQLQSLASQHAQLQSLPEASVVVAASSVATIDAGSMPNAQLHSPPAPTGLAEGVAPNAAPDDLDAAGAGRPNFRRPWGDLEDELLRMAVHMHGASNWTDICKLVPERSGKQCRERWHNHLNPSVRKAKWTEEEDRMIAEGVAELGTRWSEIVKRFEGRSDNDIKNRYNACKRARERRAKLMAVFPCQAPLEDESSC